MTKSKQLRKFSNKGHLYELEKALVAAVEKGEDFVTPAATPESELFIRGELIRAMLLGTPLAHHPERGRDSAFRATRMTAHGIRLVPEPPRNDNGSSTAPDGPLLRIAGELDLAGLAAAGGGYLPPLQFNRCIFERPINLSGTHLTALTLIDSRFSALLAADARINGKVALQRCRPRRDPSDPEDLYFATHDLAAHKDGSHRYVPTRQSEPATSGQPCSCPLCAAVGGSEAGNCSLCCVIDLRSAAINGSLEILSSYLRAPGVVPRTHKISVLWDNWAASFNGIQVRDRVNIDRTTCIGRLSFISAEIGDDVWISGGKVFASADRRSIDFQLATIGGLLAFGPATPSVAEEEDGIRVFPAVVLGQISAIGLNAAEIWLGEGFYFGHDEERRGAFATINFAKVDTKRSFKVGAYYDHDMLDPKRPTGEAKIHGEICLQAATIGKNLNVHGADADGMAGILGLDKGFFGNFRVAAGEAPYLKLSAHGLKVDRRVYLSHGRFRDTARCPAASAAAGVKERQPAAIDLWKSTIGIGFRIGEHCSCSGALRLNSCVIGREVIIGSSLIEPGPAEIAARADDQGTIPYLVDIAESTIKGHLKIGRHEPRAKPVAPNGDGEVVVTVRGGITLESANIQGSILLGHVSFDLTAFALPSGIVCECLGTGRGSKIEEKRIALNLRDCVCGSDLDVHSLRWRLPPLTPDEYCAIRDPPRGIDRARRKHLNRRFASIARSSFALIDLRGLNCGLLIDGFGAEWGLIYRLRIRLAGIKIGEVEPTSHAAPHATVERPDLARLRWLAFQNCRQPVVDEVATSDAAPAPIGLAERYCCARERDFVPQAYDVFSTAYRRAGEDRAAEQILIEKKNVENALRFRRLRDKWRGEWWTWRSRRLALLAVATAVLWALAWWVALVPGHSKSLTIATIVIAGTLVAWPILVALFQMTFRFGFRYGLSVQSALGVFALFILIGWGGVYWARNGGWQPVERWADQTRSGELKREIVLVLDVPYEPGELAPTPSPPGATESRDAGIREANLAAYARPSACNLDVNSLLYAIDLFIPLIDLDQERRCTIRDAPDGSNNDDYAGWRFAKAIYELLGWLVTSLVILTITGVLRRDLER